MSPRSVKTASPGSTARSFGMSPVDLIIPAIPVHVAAAWLKLNIKHVFHASPLPILDSWIGRLPHAMRGAAGQAFVSHADFVCPDNCPEPANVCTHTGRPRPMDLFRLLARVDVDDVLPIVIRSRQLLPRRRGHFPCRTDVCRGHRVQQQPSTDDDRYRLPLSWCGGFHASQKKGETTDVGWARCLTFRRIPVNSCLTNPNH